MNRLFFSIISLWLIGILLAPDVCTGDEERYIVLNSWQKGVYTLRQECTHTLLKTIDGDESERDESRLLFTRQIAPNEEDDNAEEVFRGKKPRGKLPRKIFLNPQETPRRNCWLTSLISRRKTISNKPLSR